MSVIELMWLTILWGKKSVNDVSNDPFKYYMLNDGTSRDENLEVTMFTHFLEPSPQVLPSLAKVEE